MLLRWESISENSEQNSVKVGLTIPKAPNPYLNAGIPKKDKKIMFILHFRLF